MKNKPLTPLAVLLMLIAGLIASRQDAAATVIAGDTFGSANGTLLNTTSTPIGGLPWSDGGNCVIANHGVTPIPSATDRYAVGVPFAAADYSAYNTFSVQADLDPQGVAGNWLAIGFGLTTVGGNNDFSLHNAPLWALLNNQGGWTVLQNGTHTIIAKGGNGAGGPAFTFKPTGRYNRTNLTYNESTGATALTINGTAVFSGVVSGVNTGSIAYAGVDVFEQPSDTTHPEFANFSLSGVPATQPESLSGVPQILTPDANLPPPHAPPLSPTVTGGSLTTGLPPGARGSFFQFTVTPGSASAYYPGANITFGGGSLNIAGYGVLGIWLQANANTHYLELLITDVYGSVETLDGVCAATVYRSRMDANTWYRALIPCLSNSPGSIGLASGRTMMDYTQIKSIRVFVWSDNLWTSTNGTYTYSFGGMTLYTPSEAQALITSSLPGILPVPTTAGVISKGRKGEVWTVDPSDKLFAQTPVPANAPSVPAATASSAGNAYATFLFAFRPASTCNYMTARAGTLTGPGGATIPASNVTVRYVDTVPGPFLNCPDPLPLLAGNVKPRQNLPSAAARQNFMVWATVQAPTGATAGSYTGSITLNSNGNSVATLPINLTVYNFSLGNGSHLKSLYTIQLLHGAGSFLVNGSPLAYADYFQPNPPITPGAKPASYYWGQQVAIGDSNYYKIVNNLIRHFGEHRVTPDLQDEWGVYFWNSSESIFDMYVNNNYFTLGWEAAPPNLNAYYYAVPSPPNGYAHNGDNPTWRAGEQKSLQTSETFIQSKSRTAWSYVKIIDEPDPDGPYMPYAAMAAQDVATYLPSVINLVTIPRSHLISSLYGSINTWAPQWGQFNFNGSDATARKAAGDHFWEYDNEYKINYNYMPMDFRTSYALYWQCGITGVIYSEDARCTYLTYPNETYPHADTLATDNSLDEIPSIRYEMIREGTQDYEYLWTLNNLITRAGSAGTPYVPLLTVPTDVATDPDNYTYNPLALLSWRSQVAGAIQSLTLLLPMTSYTVANGQTVTLSSVDPNGPGVAHTYYQIDGGTQTTYSAPFTVPNPGKHTVTFWSVDTAGKAEAQHLITFTTLTPR